MFQCLKFYKFYICAVVGVIIEYKFCDLPSVDSIAVSSLHARDFRLPVRSPAALPQVLEGFCHNRNLDRIRKMLFRTVPG